MPQKKEFIAGCIESFLLQEVHIQNSGPVCSPQGKISKFQVVMPFLNHVSTKYVFYCCTVHFDNIKIIFTNECTLY
jgi:hypothetical protein